MNTKTIVQIQPQLQVAEELVPLHQLAALFRKKHWGYRVAGKGVPIDKPVRIGKWTYMPSSLDCQLLHPKAAERGKVTEESGIPIRQWLYGEEDKPEVKPEIKRVQPKREWDIDWEAVVRGAVMGTFIIAGGFLLLPLVGGLSAASNQSVRPPEPVVYERNRPRITSALWCGDPALYCLLADEDITVHGKSTIVEVFRWFED